jgi:hypothetical protein
MMPNHLLEDVRNAARTAARPPGTEARVCFSAARPAASCASNAVAFGTCHAVGRRHTARVAASSHMPIAQPRFISLMPRRERTRTACAPAPA